MPGDEPVDEERLRDVAVHADDRLAVLLGEHARPIGEREQHVVPLRQEANGRGRVGIRQRRARDVEELAAVLVAEAAHGSRSASAALIAGWRIMLHASMSLREAGPKAAR